MIIQRPSRLCYATLSFHLSEAARPLSCEFETLPDVDGWRSDSPSAPNALAQDQFTGEPEGERILLDTHSN